MEKSSLLMLTRTTDALSAVFPRSTLRFVFKKDVPSFFTRVLVSQRACGENVVYIGDETVENNRSVDRGSVAYLFNTENNTISLWQKEEGEPKPAATSYAKRLAKTIGEALKRQVTIAPQV